MADIRNLLQNRVEETLKKKGGNRTHLPVFFIDFPSLIATYMKLKIIFDHCMKSCFQKKKKDTWSCALNPVPIPWLSFKTQCEEEINHTLA